MSIKQSISVLLLFFGVSFNAFAFLCEINWIDPEKVHYAPWAEIGKVVENGVVTLNEPAFWGTNSCNAYVMVFNKARNVFNGIRVDSCPDGTKLNESGICDAPPPQCTDDQIYNPDTEQCEPKWCNSSEAIGIMSQMEQECSAQNGLLVDLKCDDLTHNISSQCDLTHKDKCVIGMPSWPACLGDIYNPTDPTNPLDPPTDFNPETSNPNPDPLPPSDSDSMHHDMNKNFNTLNNTLNSMDKTNREIGKTLVKQMEQDAAIYENNKALAQQIGGDTINAINSQTKSLLDGNKALVDALSGLGDRLEPCDPVLNPKECEGVHGLTEPMIENGMGLMAQTITGRDVENETLFFQKLNESSDTSYEPETKSYLSSMTSDVINALPRSSSCTATSLDTPFGSFSLGCEFSVRLKEILAYVIYIYTLFTLSEILFTTVTPVPGTVPYSSRR
ncbi:hypothetical protein QX226_14310 [Vibrio vulnificus]|uniref:hypothetical protein n=1 Tax=Vibrio vulnificus TaxID=672 RepID=UPI00287B4B89|nr:hypothetical protein [Vibrio vulnificus]MDS1772514.1 hypothetical protein [Vibrio vulnificus]MDS1853055.1 hypothetical protein [Vibrio vulnificus]